MPFYIRFPSASSNPSVGSNGAAIPGSSTLVAGENPSGDLSPLQVDALGSLIITGTVTSSNPSVGLNGAAIPTSSTEVGFKDGSGNLQPGNITAAGNIKVDGSTVTQPISAVALPLPAGASTAAKQAALGTAGTASTDVITVQGIASMTPILVDGSGSTQPISGTVTANQGGTWNLNNISGTISLPTGAATETTLAAASAKLPATLGQKTMANSLAVVVASDQSAVPVSGTVTANIGTSGSLALDASVVALQVSQGSTTSGQKGGLALGAVTTAAPSYTTAQSSPLSLTTSGALRIDGSGSTQPISQAGVSAADKARNDYTSVNVTTSAYVQLIASTANTCNSVEIFDSSGQTLFLATGGVGSEVNQIYITPGGNGIVPLKIVAGTRISIKAVSATADSGEIDLNLYQ